MTDVRRDLWVPDFDVEHEEVMGEEWPIVIVTKWETNGIGERRYVGTRVYVQHPDESA